MLDRSEAYRAAVTATTRRMALRAVIDIIDPDMTYGAVTSSGQSGYTKPEDLHDKDFSAPARYATLEANRWLLNQPTKIFPPLPAQPGEALGFLGTELCGEDGVFPSPPWVQLGFQNVSILQACSLFFSTDPADGYPVDFTVDVMQGGVSYHKATFTGNTAKEIYLTGFTVYDPDAIRLTVSRWSLPLRYLRAVEIVPGVYENWDNSIVAAFDVTQQGNFSCLALPYGTCVLKMDNLDRRFEPRSKSGIFQSIEERQGIAVSMGAELEDGTTEYKPLGVFYQYSGGWKTGNNGLTMQWDLVDIVGLLAGRQYLPPTILPTTLSGWIASLAAQLGANFADHWTVDPAYADLPVTAKTPEAVSGMTCGDVLRFACMATGTWPRADAETGYLTAEPLWSEGGKLTLDNMTIYPVMKANNDLAAIIFTLSDGTETVVSGTATASSATVSVKNPFLHTKAAALTAARQILSTYGGNKLEVTGRGDPAGEIGDVDTVWLNESSATTGRRMVQTFSMTGGVLKNARSTLLQADGAFLYENRVVLTKSGSWTAPAGVSALRLIVVGPGGSGTDGQDGSWFGPGADGVDGPGGLIWAGTASINAGQTFAVSISDTGTVFGAYSAANGKRYPNGYTDVASGDSYGRTGVPDPLPNSGDGGAKGVGGIMGRERTYKEKKVDKETGEVYFELVTEVINDPGPGTKGISGAIGCVVIWYDKEATA